MVETATNTLRIPARLAAQLYQWTEDERDWWPEDTAYQRDLEDLRSQLKAAGHTSIRDIVPRLRDAADAQGIGEMIPQFLVYDAAAEIQRLRNEVADLRGFRASVRGWLAANPLSDVHGSSEA